MPSTSVPAAKNPSERSFLIIETHPIILIQCHRAIRPGIHTKHHRLSAGLSGVVLHQSAPHEIHIAWTRRLQAKLLVKNKVENRGKFSAMKSHRQGTIFYRAFTTN
jgi:hypothetical protein